MPREVITIQVGQCGNQIGCRFWDLILREHAHVSKAAVFNSSLSSFFRNVDSRYADPVDIPLGKGASPIRTLKARSILVDMEDKVVNTLLTGPLADLFDQRQVVTDVSGAGNNWAHGHHLYGPQYRDSLEEKVRKTAEPCDSLQCFLLMHSLGGGTGSGLGTYLLQTLEEIYPEVFRFVACVAPSKDDDVITSPYNATLALRVLIEHAHCVLPASNDALARICNQISAADTNKDRQASLIDLPQDEEHPRTALSGVSAGGGRPPGGRAPKAAAGPPGSGAGQRPRPAPASRDAHEAKAGKADGAASAAQGRRRTAQSQPPTRQEAEEPAVSSDATARQPQGAAIKLGAEKPFDRMNTLVAHLLNNLTSSMRFEGSLNMDLNEISMNLVPFPRMHFLLSSMSPLFTGKDPRLVSRGFDQTFFDVLKSTHQLMNVDPRGSSYMALAFLVRGSASVDAVNRNVVKVRKQVKMLPFNEDAFKIGLCGVPPRGLPYSVLGLANSCAAHHLLSQSLRDFSRLYSRKAHVHHYTQYMEKAGFDEAHEAVTALMKDYLHLDMMQETPASCMRPPAWSPESASSLLFAPSAWTTKCAVQRAEGQSLQNFSPMPLL